MSHSRLLGIGVKHAYYSSGLCGDFDVAPTGDTERLLKNHRCVAKPKSNGTDVYVETGSDGKPKIAFDPNTTLSFELRLKNREFPLFTDLVESALPSGGGDFQVTTSYPGSGGTAAQAFAKIDIRRDFNQVGGKDIEIGFTAKPVFWVYYLITNQGGAGSDFSVASPDPKRSAWKLAEGTDRISQQLADQYQDMRRLQFASEQMIPCRESGLQDIQLVFGGTTVIESLPNPSWRNYFQMEANGESVDAIFQVVKYLTNTTLTKA